MFCADDLSVSIFNTLAFGFFSENVPALIYYSHLTAVIVSLALGAFVYSNNKQLLPSKILFAITFVFSTLAVLDIFLWTQIDSSILLFLWSFWIFLFSVIFALSFYFLYTLLKGEDAPFYPKLISTVALLVILVLSLSRFNLESFDIPNCTAVEGTWMINTIFGLSFLLFISTVVFGIHAARRAVNLVARKQAILATIGVSCFLLMFAGASYFASIANILGAEPDTFKWEQYGYFGMTILIGFLTYLIIEYRTFNIKLLAAQALVLALIGLIASEFFFVRSQTNIILVGLTLVLAIFFGFFLVRSVKKEVKQREELAIANQGQATLIHFINHQIKGYLNKGRIVFSEMLSEPEYAPNETSKKMLSEGEKFMTEGVDFVQQILKASDIEKGTFAYDMKPVDFKEIVTAAANEQKPTAESKGLKYEIGLDASDFKLNGDAMQLREAVKNFITNSILYTPSGNIAVSLAKKDGKALFTVKDTGVGLSDEVKPKLFTKGGRATDSVKINVNSTGYGLSIVKGIVEAHKGRVWAESEGTGKGSAFFMELPLS